MSQSNEPFEIEIKESKPIEGKAECESCGDKASEWLRLNLVQDPNAYNGKWVSVCKQDFCVHEVKKDLFEEIMEDMNNPPDQDVDR